MHKLLLSFLLSLLVCTGSLAQKPYPGSLQAGDLLFQDLDCGGLCDAIEQVTVSFGGRHFSHIGLVVRSADSLFILEAIGDKVQRTPLARFVARSGNEMLMGRVKKQYRKLLPYALRFATNQLDVPYDKAFLYNNGSYYCSELIYDAFKTANGGRDFFELQPMTFKPLGSDAYFPVWETYYKDLGMDIPQGAPGINPGGISTSPKIDVFTYRP
ncbi:MAG TPA: YiiX/YebB-like N1pC/P60 family cysteine hydrolase [Chitinophagaceae bacterium]|nr:YiiX/YebB-like N1pC/P60 family cysteine hydrolase [Chitinophagaceae bacterium]